MTADGCLALHSFVKMKNIDPAKILPDKFLIRTQNERILVGVAY